VEMPDGAANTTINLAAPANAVRVHFTNTAATSYTLTGPAGLGANALVLDKTGSGTVTLANPNTHVGGTNVSNGLLIANVLPGAATTAIIPVPAACPVSVTAPGIFRVSGDNGAAATAVNILNTFSGNGTIEHQPRAVAGAVGAVQALFSTSNPNFSGMLRLATPASGTGRVIPTAAALGTAAVDVQTRHQLYTSQGQTYQNAITLAGTGFEDASGFLGALRLEVLSNWAGPVTVAAGGARICCHNSTINNAGVVSGNISGGNLELNVSNYANSSVVFLTGTNSYGSTVVGGVGSGVTPQNTGVISLRGNIGNGGTSGTLGDGPVTIFGETGGATGSSNGILGFDRSDGITLKPGNTITGAGSALNRVFIDLDCLGTGFNNNGVAITLGTAAGGGSIRAGVTRTDSLSTFSGNIEAATLIVGQHNTGLSSARARAVIDAGSFKVNTIAIANGGNTVPLGQTTGARLTINAGANVEAVTSLYAGEASFSGGNVNITGGTVRVGQQVRLGHFGNALSTMNMSGGSLILTGDAPTSTPSTTGSGGAGTTGDNNINAAATASIVGGGIYLGNDGTGVLNHSGGTITTNWIVLDNRGDSTAGGGGIDRYNISGTAELRIRSEWGVIARNVSTNVSLGGGTIRIDNTGTGGAAGNTGVDLDTILDTPLSTEASTTTTLDTAAADNSFTLPKPISGSGNLSLTGAGVTVVTGASPAYNGLVTVNAGALVINGTLAGSQTVKSGAALAGTGTAGTVVVENGGFIAPGNSVGTLTAPSVDLQAGSTYQAEITGAGIADKIIVNSGALNAAGVVKPLLVGYVPVLGDSFDLADATTTTGAPTFDFSMAALSTGLVWNTSTFTTDGVIRVAAVPEDPFVAWAAANNVAGGKGGDDDGDGASNLLEFATNSDPKLAGTGARIVSAVASLAGDKVLTLTAAVRKNAVFAADGATQKATVDGMVYVIEGTSDLVTWDSVVTELNAADSAAVQATQSLPALGAEWEYRTFRTDDGVTGDPRDFIRLKVTPTP
jgi:fibronectin-binding autotransporter adhesin